MRVCDKCKKRKVESNVKIKDKEYELCSICANHIIEWLEKEEKQGFFRF
jgi:3-phenylpropionate/cinnamic acid dioxygenase small subunit